MREADAARARKATEESKKHRDSVVAKIRAEKEERAAKRGGGGGGLESPVSTPPPPRPPAVVISVANRAKLRFQITGDSGQQVETVTREFRAMDTFATVREFLASQGHRSVTIESVHPRRTFTAANDAQTLEDLRLVPSCTLMVAPAERSSTVMRAIGGALRPSGGGVATGGVAVAPVNNSRPPHPNVDPNYVHPADNNTFFDAVWNGCLTLYRTVSRPCREPRRSGVVDGGGGGGGVAPAQAAAQRRRGPYVEVPTTESSTESSSGDGPLYFDSGAGTFTVPRNEDDVL